MDQHPHYLRPESYPTDEDYSGETVTPAPDGRPWRKACEYCLFRTSNPQDAPKDLPARILAQCEPGYRVFYCVHRTDDDGLHRVCACFAALKERDGNRP